jgi:hypothetical protein
MKVNRKKKEQTCCFHVASLSFFCFPEVLSSCNTQTPTRASRSPQSTFHTTRNYTTASSGAYEYMTLSAKKSDYTIATSNPKWNTVLILTPTVQTRILTSSTTKKVPSNAWNLGLPGSKKDVTII